VRRGGKRIKYESGGPTNEKEILLFNRGGSGERAKKRIMIVNGESYQRVHLRGSRDWKVLTNCTYKIWRRKARPASCVESKRTTRVSTRKKKLIPCGGALTPAWELNKQKKGEKKKKKKKKKKNKGGRKHLKKGAGRFLTHKGITD